MKKIAIASIALSMAALVGCSSNGSGLNTSKTDSALYNEHVKECTYRDGRTEAPKWICGYPINEYAVTEVGYSASGTEEEAKLHAMERLASRINSNIETEGERRVRTSGGREVVEFTSVTKMTVREALQGTRVLFRLNDPTTNGLHVLVVADEESYENALRQAQMNRTSGE